MPDFNDPRQDPVYKVPPIGPHFSPDDLILSPRATRGVKVIGTGQQSKRTLVVAIGLLCIIAAPCLLAYFTGILCQALVSY